MKNEKAYVLAIQTGAARYVRASFEDISRYAGYLGVNPNPPNFPLLQTVRRLIETNTPIKLVRYLDTDQYKRELDYAVTLEEEAGL